MAGGFCCAKRLPCVRFTIQNVFYSYYIGNNGILWNNMEGSESFSWDTFLGSAGNVQKAPLSAADCGHPNQGMGDTDLGYQTINFEAKNSKERFSCDQLDLSSFTQKFWRCALRVALLKKLCEKFLCCLLCAHWFWEERRCHGRETLAVSGWKGTCLSWHIPITESLSAVSHPSPSQGTVVGRCWQRSGHGPVL